MKERALALDALRGYAIVTMVLSATIASGILPAWMYHFQTPPPTHEYVEALAGLTWVDLVFPAFLFAMGAALPFSLGKKFKNGASRLNLVLHTLWRGVLLLFFAIFIQHFYPYMTGNPQTPRSWALALFCFVMLFAIYMRIPAKMPEWVRYAIQIGSMAIGTIVMLNIDYANGYQFDIHTNNIIIFILAEMAVAASLIYIFTINHPKTRIAVLAAYSALLYWATIPGSLGNAILNYTPLDWAYNPFYLRYLFIVIPATFAGEILVKWIDKRKASGEQSVATRACTAWIVIAATLGIVITGFCCIYLHEILLSAVITVVLLAVAFYFLRKAEDFGSLWKQLFVLGAILFVLGYVCEPFDGGVKKDGPSFSYLFITGGMAVMLLICFNVVCDYFRCRKTTAFLVMSGQNPMIAYVSTSLVVMPILQWTGLISCLTFFHANQWLGFLQGIILTSFSVLITMFFTKIKWVWRT